MQAQKHEFDQISKMLDLLEYREDSPVPMFCEALAETGNEKVFAEFVHVSYGIRTPVYNV